MDVVCVCREEAGEECAGQGGCEYLKRQAM